MRRLLTDAPLARCKSLLIHSGQTVAFAAVAVLAAAAAPAVTRETPPPALTAAPVAPPVKAEVEAAGPVMRQIEFSAPVRGYAINSAFGLRKLAIEARARAHKGVDIAAPKGTSVFSAAEGRVIRTGYDAGGYGNF
ncbi:MAG: M23 family metallopeptidase, partial [Brevundimonas sp.]|uniref:M23 family metallopeptidase n=1 Tax=Brevundimonas sp. TaxID=1871086 RepID=UPI001A1E9B53